MTGFVLCFNMKSDEIFQCAGFCVTFLDEAEYYDILKAIFSNPNTWFIQRSETQCNQVKDMSNICLCI